MRNILVLTDFSENAYHALFYVTKLFAEDLCHFFLLNAFSPKTGTDREEKRSKEGLEATFHRINLDHQNPKHQYDRISKQMDLMDAVREVLDAMDIHLLVLGNKGITSLSSVFWGSSTTKVISSLGDCPILAVPSEERFALPEEIAFATNYKRSFDAKVLDPLKAMAQLCGASVRILHINEEKRLNKFQESNLRILRTYLDPLEHSVHWMPNFTSKTKAIQVFLDELEIGMLAMVNYEHSFLEYLLREPVIQKMTFHITIPFLVIPGD